MQKKNENKKNKKVVVVAAMALLLALVGISGGETYAKYASEKTNSSSATVAKWGYVLSMNSTNLFGEKYAETTGKVDPAGEAVVSNTASTNVLAPGTNGELTFGFYGQSEVLAEAVLDLNVTDIFCNTDQASVKNYYPIVWQLEVSQRNNPSDAYDKSYLNTVTDINNYESTFNSAFKNIAANTYVDYQFKLTWSWAFEVNAETNLKDTVFGGLINSTEATKTYTHSDGVTYTDAGSNFKATVVSTITLNQLQTKNS